MLQIFDPIRDISLLSMAFRMLLSVVCGGAIGVEREFKRRPAGFRTHILICLGAAMTTLTGQYIGLVLGYTTDMTRLSAQVVAGIGFIGAGTIIVTGHQRIKGLTTAAGLWTTAIIGLAIGAGFYEGGIIVTILILSAELLLIRLEYRILDSVPEVNLYMECADRACMDGVLKYFRNRGIKILNMQITGADEASGRRVGIIFTMRLNRGTSAVEVNNDLQALDGVLLVEEL